MGRPRSRSSPRREKGLRPDPRVLPPRLNAAGDRLSDSPKGSEAMRRTTVVPMLMAVLSVGLATAAPGVSSNAARAMGSAIADAVDRVMPSVVVVRTEATVYRAARDLFLGPFFAVPERLAGQGSGVIMDSAGHVLTSHHVISRAQQIEVVLHDGTKYPAQLVGRDPQTDLAVLKIEAPARTKFTPIEAADSDKVRVGEFAIAVGSPFSLNSSVTLGIVSQKGRSVGVLPYEDFIQTDAPINPGNSGGPLVDMDGKMIGLNAMIQTGGPYERGNVGIAFAVPANVAMRVASSLIRSGRVNRPWVGLRLEPQSQADRTAGGVAGVVISEVLGNAPGMRCGLRDRDLIVRVDGVPVDRVQDVQMGIFKREVGDTVRLDVRRGHRDITFEIVTEQMPDFDRRAP